MIRICLRLAACAVLAAGGAAAFGQATPPGSAPGGSGNVLNPMAPPGGMTDGAGGGNGALVDQVERARREARGDRQRAGSPARRADRARPATAAEVIAGAEVKDSSGVLIGTIESVSAEGAVILSGGGRVRIPLDSFGRNGGGLLLGITKAEFDQVVTGAVATPS